MSYPKAQAGRQKTVLQVTKPYFSEDDIRAILRDIEGALRSGILTLGPNVRSFEEGFMEYVGVKHAIAVNSGTSALEIVLRFLDLKGDEVIVPTCTFAASSNAVIFAGGRPVFVDVEPNSLCLDPDDVNRRITPRTKAVIAVHIGGLVCPRMKELSEICADHKLVLIEDAAQAHGAKWNTQMAGSLGEAGCFSFYPSKVITTAEGGMITTNNDRLAEFAKSLRFHGVERVGERKMHVRLGYNWRMNELSGILGIYQLKRIEEFVARRNAIAGIYMRELKGTKGIELLPVPPHIRHAYYKYVVISRENIDPASVQRSLSNKYDIEIQTPVYAPCHLEPMYKEMFGYREGSLPIAEALLPRTVALPVHVQMSNEDAQHVIRGLKETTPY
jgi:perosamine synthetase